MYSILRVKEKEVESQATDHSQGGGQTEAPYPYVWFYQRTAARRFFCLMLGHPPVINRFLHQPHINLQNAQLSSINQPARSLRLRGPPSPSSLQPPLPFPISTVAPPPLPDESAPPPIPVPIWPITPPLSSPHPSPIPSVFHFPF